MSKKTILIIVAIFLLILGGLYAYGSYIQSPEEGGGGFFGEFLPFGKTPENPDKIPPNTDPGEVGDVTTPEGPGTIPPIGNNSPERIPTLRRISQDPISGGIVFVKTTEEIVSGKKTKATSTLIRFTDRGTGHIFETSPDTLAHTKISNTTVPKIYESLWGKDGTRVILRYLESDESIESYNALLAAQKIASSTNIEVTAYKLEGDYLPTEITQLVFSPLKDKMFYMTGNTTARGIVVNADGTRGTEIFTSPFTEWISEWPGTNTITLTTKASGITPGHVYTLNAQNSRFEKIFGGIAGLTTRTSSDLAYTLYSESILGGTTLKLYDIKHKTGLSLNIATLSEKCVWNKRSTVAYCAVPRQLPNTLYPDAWYQGKISFEDSIWRVNTGSQSAILVHNLNGTSIDAINLFLDDSEQFLFFTNKKDSAFWSLRLP